MKRHLLVGKQVPFGLLSGRGRTCPARLWMVCGRLWMVYGWLWEGRGPGMPGPYRAAIFAAGRLRGMRAVLGRPVKAPPAIALLGHLPCEGRLPRGQSPRKKAPLSGQTPPIRGRWRVAPEGERWPREARPEGLCPFAAAAHFHHSSGASLSSGCGVASGWGAFASRYA